MICVRFPLSSPLLDNVQVMVIVWKLRRNIIRTALCWVVWHNVHSQQHTERPTSFLQCFDTIGLVIWPVKIIPEMTYNVLSGTLSLYTSTLLLLLDFHTENTNIKL